jgi:hypothetical protein
VGIGLLVFCWIGFGEEVLSIC